MITYLADQAPCGFLIFDEKGIIIDANEYLCTSLECLPETLPGKPVTSIWTLSTRIFFETHLFPMLEIHEKVDEIFITLLSSAGAHIPVLMNAKKIEHEHEKATLCCFMIVSNRKQFEEELIAARNSAEKAIAENSELLKSKMELQMQAAQLDKQVQLVQLQNHELQQFNHVITHNLKEPFRKILLYSEMLSDQESHAFQKLVKANGQMKEVISGLQQYIWLNEKSNVYSKVDLQDLTDKVIRRLIEEFPHVQVDYSISPLPTIEGDMEQLKIMLHHILVNAIKFRKDNSARITINHVVLKMNSFRAVENKYMYEDFLRIEITDYGTGFDPQYTTHIFELFRKLHHSDGQGLGLAFCKKIMANHHGHIEAESVLNEYTRITLSLPCSQSLV